MVMKLMMDVVGFNVCSDTGRADDDRRNAKTPPSHIFNAARDKYTVGIVRWLLWLKVPTYICTLLPWFVC